MKKILLLLTASGVISTSLAQQKETGVIPLGSGMSVNINLNQATSLATITMTGPSAKWFAIALNTTVMSLNKDCITYGTSLLDRHMGSGHVTPTNDTTNNLTLVSNTTNGTTRTVEMTRPFNTGDTQDYTFNYDMTSLNIIWAVGPTTNVANQHTTNGIKTLTFTPTLGIDNFASLDKLDIYPNPSSGVFTIYNNDLTPISKIRIYDTDAKLLKEINSESNNNLNTINVSELSSGIYFMEISNDTDKTVKKISIK